MQHFCRECLIKQPTLANIKFFFIILWIRSLNHKGIHRLGSLYITFLIVEGKVINKPFFPLHKSRYSNFWRKRKPTILQGQNPSTRSCLILLFHSRVKVLFSCSRDSSEVWVCYHFICSCAQQHQAFIYSVSLAVYWHICRKSKGTIFAKPKPLAYLCYELPLYLWKWWLLKTALYSFKYPVMVFQMTWISGTGSSGGDS